MHDNYNYEPHYYDENFDEVKPATLIGIKPNFPYPWVYTKRSNGDLPINVLIEILLQTKRNGFLLW